MQKFLLGCALLSLFLVRPVGAEELPDMRPALLGNGPNSLINIIDTKKLMEKGQGDAIVYFSCFVSDNGEGYEMVTYRSTPKSEALAEEAIDKSERSRFIPAVYGHRKRYAEVRGSIVYGVINGKPRLRIYLNQEQEHLKHGDDFISPQWVYLWEKSNLRTMQYPQFGIYSATVGVKMDLDASGKMKDSKVAFESPAGRGFGETVMKKIRDFTFLPAYQRGKPVASTTTWWLTFQGYGRGKRWNTDQ
jgi:hypothetical protein